MSTILNTILLGILGPWQIILIFVIIIVFILIFRGILYSKSMRFELSETITTNASEQEILNILSDQFKKVADSVSKWENTLSIKKINSFFGFFRSDSSIIRIKKNHGNFLLTAEVDYRPSGWFWVILIITLFTYVGWLIPLIFFFYQKRTVRESIQDVFSRVKNEFQNTNKITALPKTDDLDQLEKLHSLKEKGIITEDEFNAKKKEILKN